MSVENSIKQEVHMMIRLKWNRFSIVKKNGSNMALKILST